MSMPLSRDPVIAKDYPNAKLLYYILKQFELRHVDWERVAQELEISNGHAARMRYTRFRQEMEGARASTSRSNGHSKTPKETRPRGRPLGRKNKPKSGTKPTDEMPTKPTECVQNDDAVSQSSLKRKMDIDIKAESDESKRSRILEPVSYQPLPLPAAKTAKVEIGLKVEGKDAQIAPYKVKVDGAKDRPILISEDAIKQTPQRKQFMHSSSEGVASSELESLSHTRPFSGEQSQMADLVPMPGLKSSMHFNTSTSYPIRLKPAAVTYSPANNRSEISCGPSPGVESGLQPASTVHQVPDLISSFTNFENYEACNELCIGQFDDVGNLPWSDADAHFDLYEVNHDETGW